MNIEGVRKILSNSFGESTYSVYVPSMNQSFSFKPLSVGQRKSISKISLEYENIIEYQYLKLAIISETCLEKISIEELTDIDFVSIVASIRKNNIVEPLKLSVPCDNTDCKEKFSLLVDFDVILDRCKNYKFKTIEFEKTISDTQFKVVLSDPSIIDYLGYQNYIDVIRKDKELSEMMPPNKTKVLLYPIQFIKDIYINNELINDFKDLSFVDRIKFLDEFPSSFIYGDDNSVLSKVIENFESSRLNALFEDIVCPKCKAIQEGVLAFDNFFII